MSQLGSGGSAVFGSRVGQVGMPDPFSDLSAVYPNLSETNAAVSGNIMSQLKGELSPGTISAIQDAAATFGVSSGMPGSGLQWNRALRDIGLTSNQVQQQGMQNYGSMLPVFSGTQTVNPETQFGINFQNAVSRAAPDPTAAGNYALELYNRYLEALGGSDGPAGGTVSTGGRSGAMAYLTAPGASAPYASFDLTDPGGQYRYVNARNSLSPQPNRSLI